jgi:hypothetical protein
MYPLSILRAVVDQQTRPGQRGAATVGAGRAEEVESTAGTRFLVTRRASGVVRTGLYGRGAYGQERYG